MKVKTNLAPSELRRVGLGLQKLAAKQQKQEIVLENPAERELISAAEALFDLAVENMKSEVERLKEEMETT